MMIIFFYPGVLVERDAKLGPVQPVVGRRRAHRREREARAAPAQTGPAAREAVLTTGSAAADAGLGRLLQLHGVSPAPIGAGLTPCSCSRRPRPASAAADPVVKTASRAAGPVCAGAARASRSRRWARRRPTTGCTGPSLASRSTRTPG